MSIAYARGKIYALLRNQAIRMAGNADLHVVCAGGFGRLLFFALGFMPGIGTVITALFMGPLITFFKKKLSDPLLGKAGAEG